MCIRDRLREVDYDDLEDDGDEIISSEMQGGWIGITDKYWLAALIPDQKDKSEFAFRYSKKSSGQWQGDWRGSSKVISPGSEIETTSYLYAGAKTLALLDDVDDRIGAYRFDLAIDFGWFYFLTKPFFYTLNWLSKYLGNFGLAIIGLTIIIKLLFFPLANGSYRSMAKMRALQPKLTELRERYKGDQQALNKAMMEMYKTEKVNPAAGCLPIFIQIPVFFALYKVLYVTIEMRHAPFYGWINDLSAKDPFFILPILNTLAMWGMQQLQPQPVGTDSIQVNVFKYMPFIFGVLFAFFPAGLVLYWFINSLVSALQMYLHGPKG